MIPRRQRNRFFVAASLLMSVTMLLGFAPTFYLRGSFPQIAAARPMSAYLYAHAAVMTAWYVLFAAQTTLVAANRADLHRRLGIAGAVVAAAVVVLGLYLNLHFAPRLAAQGLVRTAALERLVSNIVFVGLQIVTLFSLFVVAAILLRRRSAAHSRLMFLALVVTLAPALGQGRWLGHALAVWLPWLPGWIHLERVGAVAALAMHDHASLRRIHPVTLWGGGLIVIIAPLLTQLLAGSDWGRTFALGTGWVR
jgi:hypothetical protein